MTTRPGDSPGVRNGVFAALDLGTNNCRLLVAIPTASGFRVLDSFSRIVRLGEGLEATGQLGEGAMTRAIDALHACTARLARRPLLGLRAVATQACRQARNGPAFLERVRTETGLVFETITPRHEAELALESCAPLLDLTARRALLFDIGGGSTEVAWVRLDTPGRRPELIGYVSLPLGVVTLGERHAGAGFDAMTVDVAGRLAAFEQTHRIAHEARLGGVQLLGTSGTVTTLAGVALNLVRYRRPLIDGTTLSAGAALQAVAALRAMTPEQLRLHPCVGAERADFVLPGCAIFQAIHDTWPLPRITVADRGLREGMLLRLMHAALPHAAARAAPLPTHVLA